MEFEKKVALVTGSSSGIGAATAVEFAGKGIRVTVTGRKQDRLQQVSKKCQAAGLKPDEVLVVAGDITDDDFIRSIVQATVAKFGRLDILVNNAAYVTPLNGVMNMTMEMYDSVIRTNLRAPIVFTKETVPHLEKTRGCIINVSSLAGFMAFHFALSYALSKAGLDQLTRCTSTELAPRGIRVNSINPGYTWTNAFEQTGMDRAVYNKLMEAFKKLTPLNDNALSEDIAKSICFLASEDARFITGTNLVVDGGHANIVPLPSME